MKDRVDAAIQRVLESGDYVLSDEVAAFESEFAEYCGARYGIGTNSGSDANTIALLALGVGPGDEVITPANGCPSVPLSIAHTGATPVFVDIDEQTYNVDPVAVESAITSCTKALLPIHSYGQPYAIDEIAAIAEREGIKVVEDASLAAGARYRGQRVGSFGDVAIFSLGAGKVLNAVGDAGIVVTNDEEIAESVWRYHNYGFRSLRDSDGIKPEYSASGRTKASALLGYNSRLDAIQAAILRVKLRELDRWVEQRNDRAALYNKLLADADVICPHVRADVISTYRGYAVRVKNRNEVLDRLQARGVGATAMYLPPLHMEPIWRSLGYQEGDLPVTEMVAREIITLPMYPELSDAQVTEAATVLIESLRV
jgi:dTDP-4-amino-4,6-dideoxygalactose transaminase